MSPDLLDWLVVNEPSFRKSRLPSLYSDLSLQRTTNPDGYSANISAWQTALTRAALSKHLPSSSAFVLHPSEALLTSLSSQQYGRPLGLGAVVDESVRAGLMIPTIEFLAAEGSIYHKSWVPSPWTVLQWGLRQIGLAGTGNYEGTAGARKLKTTKFVLVEALEKVASQVIAEQEKGGQRLTDRIISRENFSRNLAKIRGASLPDEDVEVLLRFLERDKRALSSNEKTVKFVSPGETAPTPVTEEDNSVASLKLLINTLSSQVTILNARISQLTTTAMTSVKSHPPNRITALSALRSRKLAEKNLQSRLDTLLQLEEVLTRIEAAADQVEIVRVMAQSAAVLRGLNKNIGGVERVDEVMDGLREEMGKVEEVGRVLEEPLTEGAGVDEGEVEDELEAMEREAKRKLEEREEEERRMREEKEVEEARTKLAELDRVRATKEASEDKAGVEQLEESTKMLGRLSIEEGGGANKVSGSEHADPSPKEKEPEIAAEPQ